MAMQNADLNELKQKLLQSGVAKISDKERAKQRRYDVYIGNELIDAHLTMAQARRYRKEYPTESLRIIEYCQPVKNKTKYTPVKKEVEYEGIQNFATPSATRRQQENWKLKAERKAKRGTRNEIDFGTVVDTVPGRDPKSLLHAEYEKAFEKDGFIVKYEGREIFRGLDKELIAFFMEGTYQMNECEIVYNGKEK